MGKIVCFLLFISIMQVFGIDMVPQPDAHSSFYNHDPIRELMIDYKQNSLRETLTKRMKQISLYLDISYPEDIQNKTYFEPPFLVNETYRPSWAVDKIEEEKGGSDKGTVNLGKLTQGDQDKVQKPNVVIEQKKKIAPEAISKELERTTEPSTISTNTESSTIGTNTGRSTISTNTGKSTISKYTKPSTIRTNTGKPTISTNTGKSTMGTNTEKSTISTNIEKSTVSTTTERIWTGTVTNEKEGKNRSVLRRKVFATTEPSSKTSPEGKTEKKEEPFEYEYYYIDANGKEVIVTVKPPETTTPMPLQMPNYF